MGVNDEMLYDQPRAGCRYVYVIMVHIQMAGPTSRRLSPTAKVGTNLPSVSLALFHENECTIAAFPTTSICRIEVSLIVLR